MANFKFVVSEPKSKKSYQFEVEQGKAVGIVGKKIGDEFDGDFIGLSGYGLKITGGTDKDGFPMLPSQEGSGKKRVLLIGTPGFKPDIQGQRKRKTVRGNTVSEDTLQINTKVVKAGAKTLDEITGKAPAEEKKEEAKPEEKKTEPAKEAPKEAPKPAEKPKEEPKKEEVKKEQPKEEKKEAPKAEAKTEEKKE